MTDVALGHRRPSGPNRAGSILLVLMSGVMRLLFAVMAMLAELMVGEGEFRDVSGFG